MYIYVCNGMTVSGVAQAARDISAHYLARLKHFNPGPSPAHADL